MLERRLNPTMGRYRVATGRISGRTLVILALVPVLLVIVAGVLLLGDGASVDADAQTRTASGEWYTVERRSFDLVVVATGELEAKRKVEIKSEVNGNNPIVEIVPEGERVKEGDVLVKLDSDDIARKVEEEDLKVEDARATFIAAEQDLAIEKNETDSEKKEAEVNLALAELDRAKWVNGEVPQTKRELKLALEKAQRELERAKRDLELDIELEAQRFISRNELEESEIDVIEAENSLATAKLDIEVFEKYERLRDEKKTLSDVEQAEAELERTMRKNESRLARAESNYESKMRSLRIREARLAELKDQLEKTTIRAPQEGLVVYASSVGPGWRRRDPIQPGKSIRFNETIIVLPDTRQMVAALRVHEAMLPQVDEGQTATITIDARPGEALKGEVTQINVMAEDGGWLNPQLREYIVRIDLPPETDETLKPAMRCTGEIVIGRVDDAIAVPIQSVFAEGEEQFVYVPASGSQVRRQVVITGRASESYVEITDGLDAGTFVLLRRPAPGEVAD